MKVVALVPIKLNNERLPNKNIKSFTNGKPLVTYILNTLKDVKNVDEIYVFCSNEAIKEYLPANISYLKRDTSLDQSTTSINDVLNAFVNEVDSDIYVLTHATAPFIKSITIEKGVDAVLSGKYDSALTVTKIQNFIWEDGTPKNYNPEKVPRTQDLKPIFTETSGLYVFTKQLLLNENRRVGHTPYLIEISEYEAMDIDEKEDFLIADALYNYNKSINMGIFDTKDEIPSRK